MATAPPLIPSITKRGEPDPPGENKGLQCARMLQGRVVTYCMAFTLTGQRKYRDAAVAELMHAINDWRIWGEPVRRFVAMLPSPLTVSNLVGIAVLM